MALTLTVGLQLAPSDVAAQRGVRTLTSGSEPKIDAQISPDGQFVAFRGSSRLGVVPFTGGSDTTMVSGNVGSFLWSPQSSGVYFADNNALLFASRTGGLPRSIRNLRGSNHVLWCIDSQDKKIWGTSYDGIARTWSIFVVETNGASLVDIVTDVIVLDHVRLDPGETQILYQTYTPQPFQTREYFRADLDGKNRRSLTGGALPALSDDPHWVDAQSFVLMMQSLTTNTQQLARIAPGPQLTPLTDLPRQHRRPTMTPGREWILLEEVAAGGVPTLMPPSGGGMVPLDHARRFGFSSYLTASKSGLRVAFSGTEIGQGNSQVHVAELERELRVSPRVEVGMTFTVELPAANNEQGAVFLGVALLPMPLPLAGLQHGLLLDPTVLLPVLNGVGTGAGNLQSNVPVPNDPSMTGFVLYVQGVRLASLSPVVGDFTRHAAFRIF